MGQSETISGVLLSSTLDLRAYYGLGAQETESGIRLLTPDEVTRPEEIRFAVCWLPAADAFDPYPNLEMAMSIGAGVDALVAHPGLGQTVLICRIRDPHQADLMAGYAAHETLHALRGFDRMQAAQAERKWAPLPMQPPTNTKIAVLGNGTMGQAVTRGLTALGFSVAVACRRTPQTPLDGVAYFTGAEALHQAADGSAVLINVLPLTAETENVLNADLFDRLAPGAWLIQIGRGEHLHDSDFARAIDSGQLAGASLDVFRTEPLPDTHPFWGDARIRITPHIASDSTPDIVVEQVLHSAQQLRAGQRPALAIDRARGY